MNSPPSVSAAIRSKLLAHRPCDLPLIGDTPSDNISESPLNPSQQRAVASVGAMGRGILLIHG